MFRHVTQHQGYAVPSAGAILGAMASPELSIVIIVSAGGAVLDEAAVRDVPGGRVVEVDIAAAELGWCAALRMAHDCSREDLGRVLRTWAGARGWSVAVASGAGSG